jgi:hypothetical protein
VAASEKKLAKKAEKSRKKAAKKQYERNHAQQKRQTSFHGALLAGQVRRRKKLDKLEKLQQR